MPGNIVMRIRLWKVRIRLLELLIFVTIRLGNQHLHLTSFFQIVLWCDVSFRWFSASIISFDFTSVSRYWVTQFDSIRKDNLDVPFIMFVTLSQYETENEHGHDFGHEFEPCQTIFTIKFLWCKLQIKRINGHYPQKVWTKWYEQSCCFGTAESD